MQVAWHPGEGRSKRIGFLAMSTLLGINGLAFDAPDAEVVTQNLALADGSLSERELAEWIRAHVAKARI